MENYIALNILPLIGLSLFFNAWNYKVSISLFLSLFLLAPSSHT